MKKFIHTLLVVAAALGLLFTTAEFASASGDVTSPASCHMSANWQVKFSARYTNRNASNTIGFYDYLVVNSPGALSEVAIDGLLTTGDPGTLTALVRSSGQDLAIHRDVSKPGFVYRYDPNVNVYTSNVRVNGGSGNCTVNIDPTGGGTQQ